MPIAEDPDSPSSPGQEPDPFAELVLDDAFVKGATVKEQSGRARMLGAKWRNEPPQDPQPWRPPTEEKPKRFARRAARIDPWGNPVRRSKLNWQTPVFVLLACTVALAALNADRLHTWYAGGSDNQSGSGPVAPASPKPVVTQAPETAAPSAAPSTEAPQDPTVGQPWAGSPALSWPSGADGIVLPPAQATGAFSQSQVATQLQTVKSFLVAANVDPATVAGGTPQAALDLLERQERDKATAALTHPTDADDPTSWFSRFNPRTAVPVGNVVKVQGHTEFESDGDHGLLVHTDYTFVYALTPGPDTYRPSDQPSPQGGGSGGGSGSTGATPQSAAWLQLDAGTPVTREIVRREQDFRFYDPARYDVAAGKLVFAKAQSSFGNNYCDMGDGWLEPEFPQTEVGSDPISPSGPTSDPYDQSKPLQDDGKCGSVSRT